MSMTLTEIVSGICTSVFLEDIFKSLTGFTVLKGCSKHINGLFGFGTIESFSFL